ncbi:MAG: right-handed parallel beta-helix repeat-containing protein [Prevotella sp.]
MKRIVTISITFILCCVYVFAGDIYVSVNNGSDSGTGTRQQPLKTIETALKTAREWRRLNDSRVDGGIRIILDGGVYHIDQPIFIRPEDSGTATSPTVIIGKTGNRPAVISGGVTVKGWKLSDDTRLPESAKGKIWVADAPMKGNRMVETRQLWVNGCKANRASLKGEGIMQRMKAFDTTDESITIPTPETDLTNARQLEMIVHQRWAIAILRVKTMKDMGNGTTKVWFHQPESRIEFAHPWPQPVINGERGNSSYTITNALELLDEAGEWYQDYPSGRIYYYAREGEDMKEAEVTMPAISCLMEICGTRERQISGIHFDNISFEYASWTRPSYEGHVTLQGGFRFIDGYKLYEPGLFHKAELENQAWIARPDAAVSAQFATNISFNRCVFSHVGATALDLKYAVRQADITGCTFQDIGGTAILAGWFGEKGFETHIPYTPMIDNDMCGQLRIVGNRIHDTANEDWGCVSIGAGYVRDTFISGNDVAHTNYSGICVGWGWTPLESGMRNNRIVNNNVYDYARQLYDAGGIYTLSNQPGSEITGNHISDPYPAPYATNNRAFCIYFDEATDGYTVSDNVMTAGSFGYNRPGPDLKVNQP